MCQRKVARRTNITSAPSHPMRHCVSQCVCRTALIWELRDHSCSDSSMTPKDSCNTAQTHKCPSDEKIRQTPPSIQQCITSAHLRPPIHMECLLAQDCQLHSPNHFTTPFERPAASSEKARSALKKAGCSVAIIVWREKAPVRRAERPTEAMERNIMIWGPDVGKKGTINNERWSGAGSANLMAAKKGVLLRPASESERQLAARHSSRSNSKQNTHVCSD